MTTLHSRALMPAAVVMVCVAACATPASRAHRVTAPHPSPAATFISQAERRSPGCGRASPVSPGRDDSLVVRLDPALEAGATQRTAVVHVPATYRVDVAAPLVMEFHGAGPTATAQSYESYSPLHRLADTAGFIDVFPQGLRAPNGNLAWNAYGPVFWKVAEIPFVDALLSQLEERLCVDETRVYASGLSNGGNMVNYVACRDAQHFAAVAPVVGPMYGQDDGPCRPARPVPIIDIHSVNDPVVPYAGLPGPPYNEFPLPSVTTWLQGWAQLDGCGSAVTRPTIGGVSERAWTSCRHGAEIVAYATEAGHDWPNNLGGDPAAQVVWRFLSRFQLSA